MITQSTKRGYFAVNMSFAAQTNKVTMTANKDMTINGENGASVTLRQGEKFTVVRAASLGENMFYIVRNVSGCKKCSCAAMKPCRHEKLVASKNASVSCRQPKRRSDILERIEQDREAVLEVNNTLQPLWDKMAEKRLMAPLNGNRAFSILR